jgi:replicative DNA helicase
LGGKVFFASLEMNAEALFFRMGGMQISETDKMQYESAEIARRLNGEDFERTINKYGDRFRVVDKDALTIDQIEKYLTLAREQNNISLLLIDYLGYIRDTESGSAYDKVSRIAKGIKGLAKRANTRIVLLCQTSRAGEDGTVPVMLHHLRDSGAIEESADNVLGLWHAQEEGRLHAELLKARHVRRNSKMYFMATGLSLAEDEFKTEDKKKFKINGG